MPAELITSFAPTAFNRSNTAIASAQSIPKPWSAPTSGATDVFTSLPVGLKGHGSLVT